jgi:integration host factor subunit beta
VTKKEIVKEIADRANLTQLKTKEIVQWTFDAIVKTLTEDGRIELRNFGVFEVKRRKPRKARNPRTGARVDVEAKNVVTFKPGKKMEEDVGRMTSLPHLEQPVKRPKASIEVDGNGTGDHEDALETVGARPRKTS